MADIVLANPGLTSAQVAERVAQGESNDFRVRVGRTYWQIVRDNVLNVFNIILFILLLIMLTYGDLVNILFASFSVVVNTVIGLTQEINAKRALDRLAALSVQEVKVWRDGELTSIPITRLVKDDVIPVEPGDRIAVDGEVLKADSFEMDESLLTGESDAVQKEVGATLHSGSFCIAGAGLFKATQVGANSTINKLSQTAKAYRNVLTPTQMQINLIVQISIFGMALFAPMSLISGITDRLLPIEIVRNLLVLVTSFVPQGLVLATTVSLTLGALRISRHKTLVQRVNAVESMANVNVLCFDKTGTLTRNQLSVVEVLPLNGKPVDDLRQQLHVYTDNMAHLNKTAAAIALYAGGSALSPDGKNGSNGHNDAAKLTALPAKQLEIPFTSGRKWGAIVFDKETFILGAPERVLDPAQNPEAVGRAQLLATEGQRVLAFAHSQQPISAHETKLTTPRQPLALIVMSDHVRDDIRETLVAFTKQGVSLKVISGDNLETVTAIAQQAGIHIRRAYSGEQLEAMSDGELDHAALEGTIFARIEPETKRKLVRALKQQGRYVAMVGDGVNDVPALKEANMAIAMNDGAQITKDVADVVLLNNAMSTLPLAFEEGKKITQKILGTAKLFLTKNFFTILAFIFIGYMALPFASSPIQISWLTFGAVNIPAFLITFDLLRPAHIQNFTEVLNYVVPAVLIGSVSSAILYALSFLYLRGIPRILRQLDAATIAARNESRSALLIFLCLYGLIVFWNTHGIDILRPRTFRVHYRVALLAALALGFTIVVPFFWPHLFVFVAPSLEIWLLIIVTFAAATLGLGLLQRNQRRLQFFSLPPRVK